MDILLANPRGFCAGVDRAIEIVERAIQLFGTPIYVRHEVVHNRFVVDDLKQKGAIFVDELDQVPDDNYVIFSAHGVSRAVRREAERRELKVFDATCPLVTKVHMEVSRYSRRGIETILIGHRGHPEVEGTMGQYERANGGDIYLVESADDVRKLEVRNADELRYVTQTTLSKDDTAIVIDSLHEVFPRIQGPKKEDICYATQNRQDAVKQLAERCDLILVVGSRNSSNSNRLREIAENKHIDGYLIDSADDIRLEWLQNKTCVGVTAGASAPELLVNNVVQFLQDQGAGKASSLGFTAYNNAPSYVASELEDAFDLDDAQSSELETRMQQFFSWHRQQELGRYKKILDDAAHNAADGITAPEYLEFIDGLRLAFRRLLEQAIDSFGDLGLTLTPAQIDHYDRYYREDSAEYYDYLEMSAQQREIFRIERALERLE
jgi:4-hydroxy-3-methylbut-2-enyl diphosphate reductase